MLILLGLCTGILIGYLLPYGVPVEMVKYISVSFLAGLDSVVGAVRSDIENKYDTLVFSTGFISNAIIAAALTYLGDRLGVDLYLAALLTFGVRIFQNLGWIRRDLITRWRDARTLASGEISVPVERVEPPSSAEMAALLPGPALPAQTQP
jgi:small basic protein